MKTQWAALLLGIALLVQSASAQSDGGGSSGGKGGFGFLSQKSSIKKASRWTLEDWLATKERMQWSNMWLSFNSPSPYEFFLLGAYSPTAGNLRYGLGAYAQGVGLEFEQETIFDPAWNGRFHFRLFGVNVQNTNLTLHGGIRGRSNAGAYRQGFFGASLTLYLRNFFGVFTQYRRYAGSTPNSLGNISGSRFEIGPFMDFGFVRIFGNYISESENVESATLPTSVSGSLWNFGAQLFF